MRVKFGITGRYLRERASDVGLMHAGVLEKAENGLGVADAAAAEDGPGAGGQAGIDGGVKGAIAPMARGEAQVQEQRIERQTQSLDAELDGILHEEAEDGGVQVEVQMAVDMVERQAGVAEFPELSVDFGAQLFAQGALEKVAE